MKHVSRIQRLERLSQKLNSVELSSTEDKNGTYKIKFKDTILFDGIPDRTLEDYIMWETTACFAKIGKLVQEYIKLTMSSAEQLELEFFKQVEEEAVQPNLFQEMKKAEVPISGYAEGRELTQHQKQTLTKEPSLQ